MNHFKVTEEFKKNPELKEEDLIHLKEWLSKQPHLPHVTGMYFQITNNKWLLITFRSTLSNFLASLS